MKHKASQSFYFSNYCGHLIEKENNMYEIIGNIATILLIYILLICCIRMAIDSFKKSKWWMFSINVTTTYILICNLFITMMGGVF